MSENVRSVMNNDLVQALNSYSGFLEFKKTDHLQALLKLENKTIGVFGGNRSGKSADIGYQYFLRVIGIHPVEDKNRLAKKIRCISSTLPISSDSDEQDNAQYIILKKLIPPELIIKDITARSQNLVVRSRTHGKTIFEFRSSKQELQDLGKIPISSLWHDEETPLDIREECKQRLVDFDGDELFSLTPANDLSWTYDDIWMQKSYIYRTKIICDRFGEQREEFFDSGTDIACIHISQYDNPILSKEVVDKRVAEMTDPDMIDLRIYGVFKQISGRVHKTYDPKYCYISFKKYFPQQRVPDEWLHCRGIDYHESRTPWSIGWLSISPYNEWFLRQEFHPAIDGRHAYNTHEIVKAIVRKSEDYEYKVNLIDPLANKKQANSGFSTTEDINRHFKALRQNEGLGRKTFWSGWDTKGTVGRDTISMRFKNAVQCGVPFNNAYRELGIMKYLPTLWICDTCPKFHKSILSWSFGEHVTSAAKAVNDPKNYPKQKYSHDNMVLECLAKDYRVQTASRMLTRQPVRQEIRQYSVAGR